MYAEYLLRNAGVFVTAVMESKAITAPRSRSRRSLGGQGGIEKADAVSLLDSVRVTSIFLIGVCHGRHFVGLIPFAGRNGGDYFASRTN